MWVSYIFFETVAKGGACNIGGKGGDSQRLQFFFGGPFVESVERRISVNGVCRLGAPMEETERKGRAKLLPTIWLLRQQFQS